MTSAQAYYCEIDFPDPSQNGRLAAIYDDPECILTASTIGEVPGLLSKVEAYANLGCWVIGFVAYEGARAFDKALQSHDDPPSGLPFAQFVVYRNVATIPRQRREYLNGVWRDSTRRERFDASIAKIKHNISEGNYYQVNYTTCLEAPFFGDGLAFFDRLKASQPSAYCAYLDFGNWRICSVSPELFFHYGAKEEAGRILKCRPMKGTATRHADFDSDLEAALRLQMSQKERAENLMIVDLIRNDLSRVARPYSIDVPHLFSVEAWPTVWQMTSTVTCRVDEGMGLLDIFRALFPCGSVTGAPKAAAMSAIKGLEANPRGVYCGAVGVVMPGGEAVFSVGIRTPVINVEKAIAVCGIGSGITMDSKGNDEYAEWGAKQRFLQPSYFDYELLETIRLHQGRFWLLDRHLKRIERSAIELGFSFDTKRVSNVLKRVAEQHKVGQWRLRLRLSATGEVNTDVLPLDILPHSMRIVLANSPIDSGNPWLGHKTSRRDVYSTKASKQDGVFDTLLFNERNELTEFTCGNLVIELKGHLLTPTATCGLLPGVLREVLLNKKCIREEIVTADDLAHATHIWFANSVRGLVSVKLDS
jgi:para-aminobenzoate synthetase/4-amino-4-deoxychorismate lyase